MERQQGFNAQQVTAKRTALIQDLARSNALNLKQVETWFS
jgi:hypothetical protein